MLIYNREIKKSLDRLAKTAEKNPGVAAAAGSIMEQKTYASVNFKQVGGLLKDIGKTAWEHRKAGYGLAAMGVGTGVGTYLIDKGVQYDAKRIGMPIKGQQTPPSVGAPQQQKNYSILSKTKSFGLIGQAAGGAAFAPLFTLPGYLKERQQFLEQKAAAKEGTQGVMPTAKYSAQQNNRAGASVLQRKSYSYIGQGIKTMGKGLASAGRGALSFVGMVGKKNVKTWGQQIFDKGIKNNNLLTQRVGNYMLKNPNASLGLMGAAGFGTTAVLWDAAEKPTKMALKAVDKNAFAYTDKDEGKNESTQQPQRPT